jgi:hypothetical protein
MIGAYLIIAVVLGIVLSYLAIIHHFWLRDVFKEEAIEQPLRHKSTKGQTSKQQHRKLNEASHRFQEQHTRAGRLTTRS